ncbi:hypothetical protein Bbelb_283010 [Branchiostoma belcheri]|nr:hypothetical protein Bbelb_283010 [Branchiostoma belcheri]
MPEDVIRKMTALQEEDGLSFQDALHHIRKDLIPDGYMYHTWRLYIPETELDMLRSVIATHRFRSSTASFSLDCSPMLGKYRKLWNEVMASSTPVRFISGPGQSVICPYNDGHIVRSNRLLRHILKCRKQQRHAGGNTPPELVCRRGKMTATRHPQQPSYKLKLGGRYKSHRGACTGGYPLAVIPAFHPYLNPNRGQGDAGFGTIPTHLAREGRVTRDLVLFRLTLRETTVGLSVAAVGLAAIIAIAHVIIQKFRDTDRPTPPVSVEDGNGHTGTPNGGIPMSFTTEDFDEEIIEEEISNPYISWAGVNAVNRGGCSL